MTELEPQFLEAVDTSALEMRGAFAPLLEGVLAPADLKVTVGAGRTVDVAAGVALVQGDAVTDQGLYRCRSDLAKNSAAFALGGIAVQEANPRLDLIVARVYDHTHDASGQRKWQLEVIKGTNTVGATLDNRTGAPALPASALLLADVLVDVAGAVTVRDRRKWSRGVFVHKKVTSGTKTGTASYQQLDATLATRVECSGLPIKLKLVVMAYNPTAGAALGLKPRMDGADLPGAPEFLNVSYANLATELVAAEYTLDAPAAGSHLFDWQYKGTSTNQVILATAAWPIQMEIREEVRASGSND
jgi:hypothetical protein